MAKRTAQRAEQRPERLQRTPESINKYFIEPATIPDGQSYEWKRMSTMGKEDRANMIQLSRNHWKPVPSDRHPELAGGKGNDPIIIDGLMLMERPMYLTEEAHAENRTNAVGQVDAQMSRLDQISGIGKDFVQSPKQLERTIERVPVPEDE